MSYDSSNLVDKFWKDPKLLSFPASKLKSSVNWSIEIMVTLISWKNPKFSDCKQLGSAY